MADPGHRAARIVDLVLSGQPDAVRQGLFLLDSAGLPDAVVIDALVGPRLSERLADPDGEVPRALWDRLPGLAAALRAAPLPDVLFLSSPLAGPYQEAFGGAGAWLSFTEVDADAWAAAEALRARLGLPLPFAALIQHGGSRIQDPYDALCAVHPGGWRGRLRRWMCACAAHAVGEHPALDVARRHAAGAADAGALAAAHRAAPSRAIAWATCPDAALTLAHAEQGALACCAPEADEAFAGARSACRAIALRRQAGMLWAQLSDSRHRWPLSLSVMSAMDGVEPESWFDEPEHAFWIARPQTWQRDLRLWGCDCAARVLSIGDDPRLRRALAATRAMLRGDGDRAAWAAARVAAEAAHAEAQAAVQGAVGERWEALAPAALAARGILLAVRGDPVQAAAACEEATRAGRWAPAIDEDEWQRARLWECLRAP